MYSATWHKLPALAICLALAQTSLAACATGVHAIMARGQGPGDDLNVLVALQDEILKKIPGSTSLGLPYDHDASDKFAAIHDGALLLQNYVKDYVKDCPNSKLVLFGYSLGAVLTMDAICGTSSVGLTPVQALDASYNANVIATIVYGDETYLPLMPWNVGNCTVGAGLSPRLLGLTECAPYADTIQSYCDYGDDQCCFILPADNNAAHHTYFDKYDDKVVEFIQNRLSATA